MASENVYLASENVYLFFCNDYYNCIDYTRSSWMARLACDASSLHHDASQADRTIELDRA